LENQKLSDKVSLLTAEVESVRKEDSVLKAENQTLKMQFKLISEEAIRSSLDLNVQIAALKLEIEQHKAKEASQAEIIEKLSKLKAESVSSQQKAAEDFDNISNDAQDEQKTKEELPKARVSRIVDYDDYETDKQEKVEETETNKNKGNKILSFICDFILDLPFSFAPFPGVGDSAIPQHSASQMPSESSIPEQSIGSFFFPTAQTEATSSANNFSFFTPLQELNESTSKPKKSVRGSRRKRTVNVESPSKSSATQPDHKEGVDSSNLQTPRGETPPLDKGEHYKNLGNESFKKDRFHEAISNYTKAIEFASKPNAVYYGNRAAAYLMVEDFQSRY
jgi:hypothetical protein